MSLPLEGYRVLDWTVWQQGPVASMMLGDLGAEVIKIEERTGGDPTRGVMKLAGVQAGVAGRNFYFEYANRNKKSLVVDLRKEEGKEIIYKLVEKSDVFLQNFRQGVAARMGLDYATLSKYNPKLIYVSASGWGPTGPDAEKPSFDFTGLAKSGLMTMVGEPDMPPQAINGGIADQTGAVIAAYGTLVALLARERTGVGQEVNTSLLSGMLWMQGLNASMYLVLGTAMPRTDRTAAGNPLWNHYRCQDAKWIVLANLQMDRHWPAICRALGMEELENDPRFADMMARGQNARELITIMDKIFAGKPRDEWCKILQEAGDLVFECVNTVPEMVNDPQTLANDYVTEFQHPVLGPIKVVAPPIQLSKTPVGMQREAPEFGEHTEMIMTELLDYSWEDVIKFKDQEVI